MKPRAKAAVDLWIIKINVLLPPLKRPHWNMKTMSFRGGLSRNADDQAFHSIIIKKKTQFWRKFLTVFTYKPIINDNVLYICPFFFFIHLCFAFLLWNARLKCCISKWLQRVLYEFGILKSRLLILYWNMIFVTEF